MTEKKLIKNENQKHEEQVWFKPTMTRGKEQMQEGAGPE